MKGKVRKFRDDVNTDEIIPAKYLVTSDPKELAEHCMAGIDEAIAGKLSAGDIMVAGRNFGCGSSREHAPLAIKAAGISCVVAESFARIFYRNSINIGLPIIEISDTSNIEEDDELEIDLAGGVVKDVNKGKTYTAAPFPDFMQELIKAGGLMEWAKHYKER